MEAKQEAKIEAKAEAKAETKEEGKPEAKAEAKAETKADDKPAETTAAAKPSDEHDFDAIARRIPPGFEPKTKEEKVEPTKEIRDPFVNTSGAPIAPASQELGNGDHWTAAMPESIQNGGAGKHHWSTKMKADEEKGKASENKTSPATA